MDRVDDGPGPGLGLLPRTPGRLDTAVLLDGVPQQSLVVDRAVEDGGPPVPEGPVDGRPPSSSPRDQS
ncbi:hypothetical protein ACFWR9_39020, partial [Streptomyces sp. NPDC058534]|uniref:hypothetical protein n=1 Tax=Streptomyces sp. NPDC058534 TaxID=3346541 RepID=UPI003655B154